MRKIIIVSLLLFLTATAFAQVPKEEEAVFVAKKAYEDGFYEVSLTLFQRFLDKYPASTLCRDASFYIGQCYFYLKRYNEALMQFGQLLASSGSDRERLYYWIAEANFKNGDFSQAYNFYEKLVSEYPTSLYGIHAFYSLGWCLFEEGRFKEAQEKFTQFKNKFPQDTLTQEAAFKVAECIYNLKDYPELKKYLEYFAKEYPKNTKAAVLNFYLAESYFYLGDYPSALDAYSKALQGTSDTNLKNLIYLGMGWSYLKSSNYPLAKSSFDKVPEGACDKKTLETLLLGESLILQLSGQFKEAEDVYDRLITVAISSEIALQACLGKAEVLYNSGDYSESISVYKQAEGYINAETAPSSIDRLHYGLGLSYLKSAKFKEAQDEFSCLMSRSQDNSVRISTLSRTAEIYLELQEPEKAVNIYRGILKDYPDCNDCDLVQYSLGVTLLNSKLYLEAIEEFRKLIDKYPASGFLEEANFYLATAYFQMQDFLNSYLYLRSFVNKYPKSNFRAQAIMLEGLSLKSLKRFQEAQAVFKGAINELNQDKRIIAKAEFEITDCMYYLGNQQEALEKFESLRSKYPEPEISNLVLWRLSEHYFNNNNFDLCMRYLLGIIQNNPADSLLDDSYYMLGLCYQKQGRLNDAVDTFLKIKGRGPEIYPKIAEIYKIMGDLSNAISYYRLGLNEKDTNKPELQFKLAECLEESGKLNGAMEEYLKIASLVMPVDNKSGFQNTQDSRGMIFMVKGLLRCGQIFELQENWKEAVSIYEKIAGLDVEESKFAKERIALIREQYLVSAK